MSPGKNFKIVGKKIVDIRPLSEKELDDNGWESRGDLNFAVVLDDGTILYASSDPEGNGLGCMFVNGPKGDDYYLSEDMK